MLNKNVNKFSRKPFKSFLTTLIIHLIFCIPLTSFSEDTVKYTYDKSGNRLTAEKEPLPTDQLMITNFVPQSGLPGITVVIYGRKFIGDIAGNVVKFNGVVALVLKATPTIIVAQVPQDATTGPISVQNIYGIAYSSKPFIIQGIKISPKELELDEGAEFTFSATVIGTDPAQLKWFVENIEGGNAEVGTITTIGHYKAPQVNDDFFKWVIVTARIYTAPNFFIQDTAVVIVRNLDPIKYYEAPVVGVRKIAEFIESKVCGFRKASDVLESKVFGYRKVSDAVESEPVSYRRISDFVEGRIVSYSR
ncbi:MAG: IPT/TIG domain-containing protein [Candidatus Sumerlaeia bacterium]|nr:IPT/TIG domain-containing protein [Candidatus Sumerlaeia bacterium]